MLDAIGLEMLAALKEAYVFISEELETRKGSFLPNPNEGEQGYIGEAEEALETVRQAIAKAEAAA